SSPCGRATEDLRRQNTFRHRAGTVDGRGVAKGLCRHQVRLLPGNGLSKRHCKEGHRAMSIKLAVLVSGQGSNMEAILKAIEQKELDAKVEVVLSNNPEAPALEIARRFGVSAVAVDSKGLSRQEHEQLICEKLSGYKLDYVVLAGYMRILTP